jgi:uncharacterized membrane protein YphA (DoxX/SURF4 family)
MSIPRVPWWVAGQITLVAGIAVNVLGRGNATFSIALGVAALALTFASHDLRGRAR